MKIKSFIGIILIIASLLAMFFWETRFRDKFEMQEVLVAAGDIAAGQIVTEDSFKTALINSKLVTDGSMSAAYLSDLLGKVCINPIKKNNQVTADFFKSPYDTEGISLYDMIIPKAWIHSKSTSLVKGSVVYIYSLSAEEFMGSFEVRSIDEDKDSFVEISCTLEDYFKLCETVTTGEKFILAGRSYQ